MIFNSDMVSVIAALTAPLRCLPLPLPPAGTAITTPGRHSLRFMRLGGWMPPTPLPNPFQSSIKPPPIMTLPFGPPWRQPIWSSLTMTNQPAKSSRALLLSFVPVSSGKKSTPPLKNASVFSQHPQNSQPESSQEHDHVYPRTCGIDHICHPLTPFPALCFPLFCGIVK